jgi:hypothetical protein
MKARAAPTTRTTSRTRSIPRSRWPVRGGSKKHPNQKRAHDGLLCPYRFLISATTSALSSQATLLTISTETTRRRFQCGYRAKIRSISLSRGLAALITCVAQALNESDPTFQKRFLNKLETAYDVIRHDTEGDVRQELDLLSTVREVLTG